MNQPHTRDGRHHSAAQQPTNDAADASAIFVDDLHLTFRTPDLGSVQRFERVVHEGTCSHRLHRPSPLAIDLTLHKRLTEAIDKISGAGLKPNETPIPARQGIILRSSILRNVAFDTVTDHEDARAVHNRRALVYVSNGYDFNPFSETRKKNDQEKWNEMNPNAGSSDGSANSSSGTGDGSDANDVNPFMRVGNEFSFADLASELSELTREANRANTTIYTIDPRGLVGMPDLDQNVDMMDFQNYIRTSQDSLRVLSEQTGGFATINQNDMMKALKRIDAETSDYYVIGYYSSNPDPTMRKRKVEIKVNRPNMDLRHRTEYTLADEGAARGRTARRPSQAAEERKLKV
jgi:VWFA-related protein